MSGPFFAARLTIAERVGPHELLDALALAEAAEMGARKMRQRVQDMVARFGSQRGYRMVLPPQEARRLALVEAADIDAARANRRGRRVA
jgi:hypothetical protein